MYLKFDINKHKRELNKIAKENDISSSAAIIVILNEMLVYNEMLKDEDVNPLLLFQVSSSIFKKLTAFQLTPTKKKEVVTKDTSTDKFAEMLDRVKNVK